MDKASILGIYAEIGCSWNVMCRTEGMQTNLQNFSGSVNYRAYKIVKETQRGRNALIHRTRIFLASTLTTTPPSLALLLHHASYYQIQSNEDF